MLKKEEGELLPGVYLGHRGAVGVDLRIFVQFFSHISFSLGWPAGSGRDFPPPSFLVRSHLWCSVQL